MKKFIAISLALITIVILFVIFGGDKDEAAMLTWLHSINKDNAEVYFWEMRGGAYPEKQLSEDEVQTLSSILAEIPKTQTTWNEALAGGTPTYGFRIVTDGEIRHINQADARAGDCETNHNGKQWWILSRDLKDFMCSFLE